jgi:hypothetical protein
VHVNKLQPAHRPARKQSDVGVVFHHAGTTGREPGADPQHRSYPSFASFSDPDGDGWIVQENSHPPFRPLTPLETRHG